MQAELGSRIGNALYEDALRKIIGNWASAKPTDELEAYELVQLAAKQNGKWNKEANARALELVDLALTRAPRSSAALLWKARVYHLQVDQGFAPEGEAPGPTAGRSARTRAARRSPPRSGPGRRAAAAPLLQGSFGDEGGAVLLLKGARRSAGRGT